MKKLICMIFLFFVLHTVTGVAKADNVKKRIVHGMYFVEFLPESGGLWVGNNSINMIVRGEDGMEVEGAEIRILPWMVDIEHGVSEVPVVMEKGSGVYEVEDILIIMPGQWELLISIEKDNMQEIVVYSFSADRDPNRIYEE